MQPLTIFGIEKKILLDRLKSKMREKVRNTEGLEERRKDGEKKRREVQKERRTEGETFRRRGRNIEKERNTE